jgi:hypothetical protein
MFIRVPQILEFGLKRTSSREILELEQLVFLFDWTNANDRWN